MLQERTPPAFDWPDDRTGRRAQLHVIDAQGAVDAAADGRLIERRDLVQALDRALDKRVTVVSAPAGSGKTSLLRMWVDRSTELRDAAVVSVARDQRSAHRFWGAVLDAIPHPSRAVGSETDAMATDALDADQLLAAVIARIAEHALPIVLIIDDLHELRAADALRQLEHLLAALPGSARLVLSSRRDPPIRLHRLRLEDEVAEIRADDLRFTERETRELLLASGIALSDAGAAALHQRTEGWAAGLRLAVIALGRHPDPERFVAEFSGSDRAIGEYLMAEMLERQPSGVQSMLLRTSLVDRVNGELADLLAGHLGSERMLLELEDANAFVVSLDTHRTWFRYHQLLTDFLRMELRRTAAAEVAELHRRAARWLADHGDVVEAVHHTLAAGDWPEAARLVADHSFIWVLDGQAGTIDAILEAFPEGASADHPDLALAHAASEVDRGRWEDAAAQLTLAESRVRNAPPARRHRLVVAIASLRLAMARRSGRFRDVLEQVNLLDASIADDSSETIAMGSELRAVALMNLGIVETWSRRYSDAERHLSAGAALAQAIGRPYLEVACRAHQIFPTALVSVAGARERGRQTVALAERHGLGDRPILAPAFAALAFWAIWMGEFDEGERALRRAWKLSEREVDPAFAVLAHMTSGQLHLARGQHHAALDAFAAAEQAQSLITGVPAFATPVVGWIASTQARLGMSDAARETLAGFSGEPDGIGFIHNARAAICMVEGDPAAALDVLREGLDLTPRTGPSFTIVEAHLRTGIAHLALGDRDAASASLETALAAAEPDRLIFPFVLTEAAALLDVLPRYQTAHAALLADVVDVLRGGSACGTGREPPAHAEELSPSELRVLRYLPTNMTRPEIAQELYVSVNTVNTHIRNIYSKLDARSRSSAVARARELRLVAAGGLRGVPR